MIKFFSTIMTTFLLSSTVWANTIDSIKSRGFLNCGVNTGLPGFSFINSKGEWEGFDVEFCRALASAILNDPSKVKYFPLHGSQRFTALVSGTIDVLSRNTTWTMARDTQLGVSVAVTTFHDGSGFILNSKNKIKGLKDLNNSTICFLTTSSNAQQTQDFFKKNKLNYNSVYFEDIKSMIGAYEKGRCNLYSNDLSQLASIKYTMLTNPESHSILDLVIAKSPLGPVVRQNEDTWRKLVAWTHFIMLTAEELRITSENIDFKIHENDPEAARLLGLKGNNFGKSFDLDNKWAYRIIKYVGNYEEVFEKNLGKNSYLKMERGMNALWSNGGLQISPPLQ